MRIRSQWQFVLTCLVAFVAFAAWQSASADDVVHVVSGVVKHIDRDGKTIVVKVADGTEQTVKYTEKTTWKTAKKSDKDIDEGSKVAVRYTEKAGEKTAVGVKDLGKDAGKVM
jgi:hypothetical protein